AYAVTVQSQPPGLVCSVSNGAGTMGAGDVSDVAITCQKNTSILYFFKGEPSAAAPTSERRSRSTPATPNRCCTLSPKVATAAIQYVHSWKMAAAISTEPPGVAASRTA